MICLFIVNLLLLKAFCLSCYLVYPQGQQVVDTF